MGPSELWQPPSRGFVGVGLHMPKTGYNVGGVLRAASCFWVDFVAISGYRIGKKYIRTATDVLNTSKRIPLFRGDDLLAFCPARLRASGGGYCPWLRESGWVPPQSRSFYIFGPEDGTPGNAVTSRCSRVVTIPSAFCLNLAAAVNVVLYDRISKLNLQRNIP